jgi:MFS family permease
MKSILNFNFKNNSALRFIVFLGIVSLFADMTYEGARSITGSYLAVLGASAVTVGFVAGLGEFLGYSLRLISGYWADRSGRYWFIAILGYFINLLAVPLIGFTTTWQLVALLIILETRG